jgi:HAMP domain-containing protein
MVLANLSIRFKVAILAFVLSAIAMTLSLLFFARTTSVRFMEEAKESLHVMSEAVGGTAAFHASMGDLIDQTDVTKNLALFQHDRQFRAARIYLLDGSVFGEVLADGFTPEKAHWEIMGAKLEEGVYERGQYLVSSLDLFYEVQSDGAEAQTGSKERKKHGSLVVLKDLTELQEKQSKIFYQTLWIAGGILLMCGLLAVWLQGFITRPILQAIAVADGIGVGDLTNRVPHTSLDETGQLARSLNRMADGLQEKAQVAAAIARGDLTQEVPLASKEDTLGLALDGMARKSGAPRARSGTARSRSATPANRYRRARPNRPRRFKKSPAR